MVELLAHHPKIESLRPAGGRGKIIINMFNSGSTVVEHLPRHLNVKGLNHATAQAPGGENMKAHLPICRPAHLPICPSADRPVCPSADWPICPSAQLYNLLAKLNKIF